MKDIITYVNESIEKMPEYQRRVFNYLKDCKTSFGMPIKNPDKLEIGKCYCFTADKLGYTNSLNKSTIIQYLYVLCNYKNTYYCISSFEDDLFDIVSFDEKDFNEINTLNMYNEAEIFGNGTKFDFHSFKENAKKILNSIHGIENISDVRKKINEILNND